jgi:hypothetical protein
MPHSRSVVSNEADLALRFILTLLAQCSSPAPENVAQEFVQNQQIIAEQQGEIESERLKAEFWSDSPLTSERWPRSLEGRRRSIKNADSPRVTRHPRNRSMAQVEEPLGSAKENRNSGRLRQPASAAVRTARVESSPIRGDRSCTTQDDELL